MTTPRSVDLPQLLVLAGLLAIRLGVVMVAAPPLAAAAVPARVRVAVVLVLSIMLVQLLPIDARIPADDIGWLISAAMREALLGAALAFGLSVAFMAFTVGARMLDIQIGFGIGQVLDPLTRTQMPVISALFTQLAMVTFFLLDAHHQLLRGFCASLELIPPGAAFDIATATQPLLSLVSAQFTLGFMLVAPVVLCLFLTELGLGVLSRNLPQMNMFVLGIPVKIVVGLLALAAWAAVGGTAVGRIYATTFRGWEALFR